MNLLVMPGSGNPDYSPVYRDVYAVIECEAGNFGYRRVFAQLRYPGQADPEHFLQSPSLTLPTSVAAGAHAVAALPPGQFVILARSWGCVVALKWLAQAKADERRPEKLILWGPPPYWLVWKMWVRDLATNQVVATFKGLKADAELFRTFEPVEALLAEVSVPTRVAGGEKDIYCTPAHLTYLREIASANRNVEVPSPVADAPHEVTDSCGPGVVKDYAQTLFA